MSSAPAQVVATSNNSVVGSSQLQKEFIEEAIPGRSTINFRQRGNGKVKHLIRSHAMRESTSPPRTPTPRLTTDPQNMANNTPLSPATSETGDSRSAQAQSTSPMPVEASPIPSFTVDGSQLDKEFPKLTPPKSKQQQTSRHQNNSNNMSNHNSNNNNNINNLHQRESNNKNATNEEKNNNTNNGGNISSNNSNNSVSEANVQSPTATNNTDKVRAKNETISLTVTEPNHMASQTQSAYSPNSDKENRRDNSNHHSPNPPDDRSSQCDSPEGQMERGGGGGGKKNRVALNTKGTKPRLKNNSSSSFEGTSSVGYLSRDSSTEQFTDQSGVDLVQFFKETLNKNSKDRTMLISIENELLALASDETRNQVKFPKMSSYNRMLIHRVAAYFGMEHNVDQTQQSVIAAVTKNTRVPEIRFKTLIKDTYTEEPRKSILKRDAHSFDEYRHGLLACSDKDRMLDRKAKSFEEREEEYEKVRRRIFPMDHMNTHQWPPWQENPDNSHKSRIHNNRLLKVQSVSMDTKADGRPSVSKAHSFGGYGGHQHGSGNNLPRGDSVTSTKSAGPRLFTKQDSNASTNTPWRLSPSSSGYKTQSVRSDSITPSPTGYGSDDHTPEPVAPSCGVVWAVTDIASVPRGSVLIDPQTLQPIVNQDGSIYHYDPSNLPPNTIPNQIPYRKNFDKPKPGKVVVGGGGGGGSGDNSGAVIHANDGVDIKVNNPIDDNAAAGIIESQITKENYTLEENTSLNEKDKSSSHLKLDSPKQKNQATSPNLPVNDNNHPKENEVSPQASSTGTVTPTEIYTPKGCKDVVAVTNVTGGSSTSNSTPDLNRKDDNKSNKSVPLISFNPAYQMIENSPMFPGNMTGTPAYQTASDGALYAVQPQMIYTTYPQSMDAEVPGYFVPVFDQNNGLPSSNALAGPGLYQNPTTGAVMQYGTPIYQSSVVYAPEQYSNATAANQIQQFPISYPIGYSYPFNGASYQGYWSQPMAYYVPQTAGTATAATTNPTGTPIVFPQHASLNAPVGGHNTNLSGTSKRNHHSANSHHGSIPMAAFPPNLSMPLQTADTSATTHMYAITQPVYQNMLPYAAAAPTQPTQALSHMPHQPGAVINAPLPPLPPSAAATSVLVPNNCNAPSSNDTNNSYNPINSTNNSTHNAPSSTPQSTPSTPLSLPVPHAAPKNQPPLFATPPIVPNGYNATPPQQQPHYGGGIQQQQAQQPASIPVQQQPPQPQQHSSQQFYPNHQNNASYPNNSDSIGGGTKSYYYNAANKRNYNSQTTTTVHSQYNNSRPSNVNPAAHYGQYPGVNSGHGSLNGQRKYSAPGPATSDSSSNANLAKGETGNTGGGYNPNYGGQQQPRNDNATVNNNNNRKPLIPAIPSSHYNSSNNNNNNNNVNDKSRIQRGPKPANLDLKRNSRNTPSTNSTESNNSPNSITSYTNDHHLPTNQQQQQQHPQQQQQHYHHSQPPQQSVYIARNHVPQAMSQNVPNVADHQPLISTFNPATGGMYVKFQQPYFTHPTMATALPNNRRSPPNEIRASIAPIAGMYPTVMLPAAPRQHINPRPHNPNSKGHKMQR